MQKVIDKDLADFGVRFDSWFSEASVVKKGLVDKHVEELRKKGFIEDADGKIPKEATKRIKAAQRRVQILVLSAYDDPGLHRSAEEAGVFCYLVKGCAPQLILDMIERAWGHAKAP